MNGLVSEALVDSFNIPVYIPTASEVKEVVSSIKNLQVEKIEEIYYSPIKLSTREDVQLSNLHLRATTEGILCKHFGSELMNELFERHLQKLEDLSHTTRFARVKKMQDLFLLVKRKT
ncbi:hypothetical protein RJ639_005846 [Escallonia herrerae]|uniref:SAM dependent carboxyl methyltransferase n=1 Tax=Escallonia herrerae TaxID=1293975 RepID=A0AA88VX56_9ASTE|nr:hypothetical protein RJ639_005846 [Escallonia herrerae]